MNVYQTRMKLYTLKDIPVEKAQEKITAFIDRAFLHDMNLSAKHEKNTYKNYCYDLLYPGEHDKIYKTDKIYTLTVRTIDEQLADFFHNICVNTYSKELKGLTADTKIVPRKIIEFLYTLTPIVIKNEQGYWRNFMSQSEFEQRLKWNLVNKWEAFTDLRIEQHFNLYTTLEFINKVPITMEYKKVKLLGDKIRLSIADNEIAQELAYMALGTGIGEMNARGAGFVNFRWL